MEIPNGVLAGTILTKTRRSKNQTRTRHHIKKIHIMATTGVKIKVRTWFLLVVELSNTTSTPRKNKLMMLHPILRTMAMNSKASNISKTVMKRPR